MTERKENGRITKLQIEVFLDSTTSEYFIDVTDPTGRLDVPYTIGAFLTLDETLRYVYTTLDVPNLPLLKIHPQKLLITIML